MRQRATYMILGGVVIGTLVLSLIGCGVGRGCDDGRVNLAHLEHLEQTVELDGEEVLTISIYAEAPDYVHVGDDDEGFTCVDDVARAARLYLMLYRQDKDRAHLVKAEQMLKFVLAMQTPEGEFYNFLLPGPEINKHHENSERGITWWTARGFRAITDGYEVMAKENPEFALQLYDACSKTLNRLADYDPAKGNGDHELGYDASAEILAGLAIWYRATKDVTTLPLIERFGDWVIEGVRKPTVELPYLVHKPWRDLWHAWGQGQVEALALAGAVANRPDWIESASAEAEGWQRWMLVRGGSAYMEFARGSYANERKFSQIAYDINSVVQGNMALYKVTGELSYAQTAALAASWLFGNNPVGEAMYDPETGRVYDGIIDETTINKNSGAESTIEGLMALASLACLSNRFDQILDVKLVSSDGKNLAEFAAPGVDVTLHREASSFVITVSDKE